MDSDGLPSLSGSTMYAQTVLMMLDAITRLTQTTDEILDRDVKAQQTVVQAAIRAMMAGEITAADMFELLCWYGYPIEASTCLRGVTRMADAKKAWALEEASTTPESDVLVISH